MTPNSPVLARFAKSQLGLRLRSLLGIRAPVFHPDLTEVVSDLFVWRNDTTWETRFDLFHIASVISPSFRKDYDVLIHAYDAQGNCIGERRERIGFGQIKVVKLEEIIGEHCGVGTFSVFHLLDNRELFDGEGTCLVERGYTSYRRKSDPLGFRSFAHGNLYYLGWNLARQTARSVGAPLGLRKYTYDPEVTLEDCRRFELFIVNPAPVPLQCQLALKREDGRTIEMRDFRLALNGAYHFDSVASDEPAHTVSLSSRAPILRPMLFKHYDSHFDVFHG